jgi:hypothetical protein
MSASMASTGSPAAARCRANSEVRVVLPLPPLPAKAIFTRDVPHDVVAEQAPLLADGALVGCSPKGYARARLSSMDVLSESRRRRFILCG